MDNTEDEAIAVNETTVKKKNRGSDWMNPDKGSTATGEDKKRILKEVMERSSFFNKKLGRPLKYTQEELSERISQYFIDCFEKERRPTITGMCSILDVLPETIYEWERNQDKGFSEIVKKARHFIRDFEETMALEGKTNLIYAIFRDKAIWGLVEKQEVVLTPNNPLSDVVDENELRRRYQMAIGVGDEGEK